MLGIKSSQELLGKNSDRNYDFYKDFDIEVNIINISDVENICNEIKPDIIFTGTSYTSKLEVQFIKTAKNNSIKAFPSFTF